MSSSKIKQDKENPIDVILLKLSDQLNNIFYCTNHSPNMLTTYSFICGLISCYFLHDERASLFLSDSK